jgi:GNAT superfamily N-acetyltransferase
MRGLVSDAAATLDGTYGAVVWPASQLAVDGDAIAGACVVTDDGPHLLLAFALVVPRWRGQGVGAALITRSAAALIALGHTEWTLAVTDGNPAQSLYERLGFRVDLSLRSTNAD